MYLIPARDLVTEQNTCRGCAWRLAVVQMNGLINYEDICTPYDTLLCIGMSISTVR